MTDLPRAEFPRPQFERRRWHNLNGSWRFEFDDKNQGVTEKWYLAPNFSQQILVPFVYQSPQSGIGSNTFHNVVWYSRTFKLPEGWQGDQVLLHFGAVDYRAWVWVNGIQVAYHEGGSSPFQANITAALSAGSTNQLVVRVEDIATDLEQTRGKQYWKEQSEFIFYTGSTGIWQTVWLEAVGRNYLDRVLFTPHVDQDELEVTCFTHHPEEGQRVSIEISYGGKRVAGASMDVDTRQASHVFTLEEPLLWSPETPHLYNAVLRLKSEDTVLDEVHTYFGMRKIDVDQGQIRLNNQPYVMKLVLDQGYFPEGLLTPPSDEAIQRDVKLTKAMGFNGARKHQKVADPRYLYWADRLGLLVWGEMANSYLFSPRSVGRMTAEWQAVVERDYNHPCIVAWVPINESWGVPDLKNDRRQGAHLLALYHLTKSLDSTRLVISNDGWEHTESDLLTIHDYSSEGSELAARYQTLESSLASRPADRDLYAPGFKHAGQPLLITEFGGIAFKRSAWQGWGYSVAADGDDFLRRYRSMVTALLASPVVQGFCYTQFSDVEQEINGLLTYDRQPKVDLKQIRAINQGELPESEDDPK